MNMDHFDLAIVGAGPAGCTLALNLAGSGMKIAVFDKDQFPRDKICGDALSGKVISILKRMPGDVFKNFLAQPGKTPSAGIRFVSPGLNSLYLSFPKTNDLQYHAPGYIFPRRDFDLFMLNELKALSSVTVFEGEKVNSLSANPSHTILHTDKRSVTAGMVAVADGVNSSIREQVAPGMMNQEGFSLGLRAYFTNVSGFDSEGSIELFFPGDTLPCYLWLFPPVNGLSNVGIGMMKGDILKRRVKLQSILEEKIRTIPELAQRFSKAERVSPYQAHPLPLWQRRDKISGDRFILLGDAAGLVDPFTGEGIGNAMASGEVAAGIVRDCFKSNDYSSGALSAYDRRIRRRMENELKTSRILLYLARSEWLFNLIIKLGNRNNILRKLMYSKLTG